MIPGAVAAQLVFPGQGEHRKGSGLNRLTTSPPTTNIVHNYRLSSGVGKLFWRNVLFAKTLIKNVRILPRAWHGLATGLAVNLYPRTAALWARARALAWVLASRFAVGAGTP
jgi:hypothetical protein